MTLQKTSKNSNAIKKSQVSVIASPVVNEEKSPNWKNLFGLFSQFVTVGGDFV